MTSALKLVGLDFVVPDHTILGRRASSGEFRTSGQVIVSRRKGPFTADGAYGGSPTYEAVTSHSLEAAVVIQPTPMRWNGRTAIVHVSETDTLRRSTPMAG